MKLFPVVFCNGWKGWTYPGCHRLFMRGFRFWSTIGLRPTPKHPPARERKPLVPKVGWTEWTWIETWKSWANFFKFLSHARKDYHNQLILCLVKYTSFSMSSSVSSSKAALPSVGNRSSSSCKEIYSHIICAYFCLDVRCTYAPRVMLISTKIVGPRYTRARSPFSQRFFMLKKFLVLNVQKKIDVDKLARFHCKGQERINRK